MTRVGYEKKAKLQLDAWNAQIDVLKAKLHAAEADAKKEYQDHLNALYSAKSEAEAKLEELRKTSDEAWEDMRDGYEKAWDEMQSALKKAASRLS